MACWLFGWLVGWTASLFPLSFLNVTGLGELDAFLGGAQLARLPGGR